MSSIGSGGAIPRRCSSETDTVDSNAPAAHAAPLIQINLTTARGRIVVVADCIKRVAAIAIRIHQWVQWVGRADGGDRRFRPGSDEKGCHMAKEEEAAVPELNVSRDKVCFIIVKAREFDAKVEPVEPDPGSNPADDAEGEILEDYPDDATLEELRAAIDDLNDDEVIDLIGLAWLGRGDFSRDGWDEARELARERHRHHSADYLVGMPALGDYLEEGLATLGYSCEDYESDRL